MRWQGKRKGPPEERQFRGRPSRLAVANGCAAAGATARDVPVPLPKLYTSQATNHVVLVHHLRRVATHLRLQRLPKRVAGLPPRDRNKDLGGRDALPGRLATTASIRQGQCM